MKITLTVLVAFSFSFSLLILILDRVEPQLAPLDFQKKFYFNSLETEKKKIFIIGSSQAHRVNATYIQNYLSELGKDYAVYNLAIHADMPQRRLQTIDYIIDANPEIVVYGTGFRDYQNRPLIEGPPNLPEAILPKPPEFFEFTSVLDSFLQYDFEKIISPKFLTLRIIKESLGFGSPEVSEDMLDLNTPFYRYDVKWNSILSDD